MLVHSFDVFDTVLIRRLTYEKYQFFLVAKKWARVLQRVGFLASPYQILDARVESRRIWNAIQSRGDSEADSEIQLGEWIELTLLRIFGNQVTEFLPDLVSQMREIELDTEVQFLKLNKSLQRRITKLIDSKDDQVLFASDVYLSGDEIRYIFERKGLVLPSTIKILTSSDSRFGKHSGRLFERCILPELQAGDRLFHRGDNRRSDYAIPLSLGIESAWRIPLSAVVYRIARPLLASVLFFHQAIDKIRQNQIVSQYTKGQTEAFKLGFGLSGLLDDFALGVALDVKLHNTTFAAVSGEAQMLARILGLRGVSADSYPEINRLSATYFLAEKIAQNSDMDYLDSLLQVSGALELSGPSILMKERLGIDLGNLASTSVVRSNFDKVWPITELRIEQLIHSDKQIALVDLGWGGTIEKQLRTAVSTCQLSCKKPHLSSLSGLYVCLDSGDAKKRHLISSRGLVYQERLSMARDGMWFPTTLEAIFSQRQMEHPLAEVREGILCGLRTEIGKEVVGPSARRRAASKILNNPTRDLAVRMSGILIDTGTFQPSKIKIVHGSDLGMVGFARKLLSSTTFRRELFRSDSIWLPGSLAFAGYAFLNPMIRIFRGLFLTIWIAATRRG
jgi:hypothetical protein